MRGARITRALDSDVADDVKARPVSSGALAAVLSGLATSLGALPFLFVRDLARRTYDGILGLGAGLMLAAATLGLLAEAVRGVHEGGASTSRGWRW